LKYVYGGDLLGNLWRFDFSDLTKDPAAIKIGELKAPDGTPSRSRRRPRSSTRQKT
jgi:Tfp pilus tip-associated adhesin PilY1